MYVLKIVLTFPLVSVLTLSSLELGHSTKVNLWPDVIELKTLQQKYKSVKEIPDTSVDGDGVLRNSRQAIWVPQEASDLQLRLMVIALSACAGHWGVNATRHALKERFFWNGMKDQVTHFCSERLHCVPIRGGQVIRVR